MQRRVAILGGGITGLAAAQRLHELLPDAELLLLEANSRLGGVIQTTRHDQFLVESAADNFITTSPTVVDLCRQLGLADELIATNPNGRGAMVLCRGKLEPIPSGFLVMAPSRVWPIITTRILGLWGKLRAGLEAVIPRRSSTADESLKSFVCRRFGREMFERLVQPLVGGIYTADPNQLSVAATMPRFQEMERQHGSLLRAMWHQQRSKSKQPSEQSGGARYSQFMTLRGGMTRLVDALAHELPEGSIRLNTPVCSIVPKPQQRWSIRVSQGEPTWLDVDAIVCATPAHHTATMLSSVEPLLADELRQIEYASCAVVSLAYRRADIAHPLNSFGLVVPLVENRLILSCSFSSLKYSGRAPEDTVLMRVFVGGAVQSGVLRLPNEQLMQLAEREVSQILGIRGAPLLRQLTMQHQAMPQYHVGHLQRVERIQRQLERHPTLALAGSSLHGVGVPGCVESGRAAAERIAKQLETTSATTAAHTAHSLAYH